MTNKRGPHICKVDANQGDIVEALRKAGASVQPIHVIGQGCPDLLIGYQGRNYLMEVKAQGCKLTPDERDWRVTWRGQVDTAHDADEALYIIDALPY